MSDMDFPGRRGNRLASESSPYLLQHAHNPVDWHPWGPGAFARAKKENKPIFLSVGYSTCYWCHVMERESFENESIAARMNQNFISIKVDREERPDVDQLYMMAVQLLTHQGGWPMSVFLTPDLRPFYGGTYFPPQDGHGRAGFPRLLGAVHDAYANRRDEVERAAEQLVSVLRKVAQPDEPESPMRIDEAWVERLIRRSTSDFDPEKGGFGAAPKFPRQTLLELLLVYLRRKADPRLAEQLRITLDAMMHGGIRDHLGGGFHRYSTDADWLVPHFEIMLYDNAMLLWIYAEAFAQTSDRRYAAVARGIADFVLREMTSPRGAFYTALDAEVDAREGGSYLWTLEEVQAALAPIANQDEIDRFSRIYGLSGGPNFVDPHHGSGAPESSVLHLADPGPDPSPAILDQNLERLRQALYEVRRQRKQPLLDTKILTSWNALMIRGLAHAGKILQEPRYVQAAAAAADYLLQHHGDGEGGLLRVSAGGSAKYPAFLDDYAFLVQALLALGEVTDDPRRRGQADALALVMQARFSDEDAGGFFYSDERAQDLIVRQKIGGDSPLPSGNGIAALAYQALGRSPLSAQIIGAFAAQLEHTGPGSSALVQAALCYVRKHGHLDAGARPTTPSSSPHRPSPPHATAERILSVQPIWESPQALVLRCRIESGYHINTDRPAPGLIPTSISVSSPTARYDVQYPPGQMQQLSFSDAPQPLYVGRFDIKVRFVIAPTDEVTIALRYQACDENACLAPVTKLIDVPAAAAPDSAETT